MNADVQIETEPDDLNDTFFMTPPELRRLLDAISFGKISISPVEGGGFMVASESKTAASVGHFPTLPEAYRAALQIVAPRKFTQKIKAA